VCGVKVELLLTISKNNVPTLSSSPSPSRAIASWRRSHIASENTASSVMLLKMVLTSSGVIGGPMEDEPPDESDAIDVVREEPAEPDVADRGGVMGKTCMGCSSTG
jgi:hypothetical protein